MQDDLNSFKQNPTQNFAKTSLILKNPKIFQKPQKLGQKEMHDKSKRKNHTRERKISLGRKASRIEV